MPRPPAAKSSQEEAEFDLIFPTPPAPSQAVFAALGEEPLRALVRHHHELLRCSSIGDLFPRDPKRFAAVVERIATFMIETTRGSTQFIQAHGPTWFRSQHLPLTIDETARNVWLAALLATFEDVGFPDAARVELWNWVEAQSIRAITRRTMVGQPRRYPLAEAPAALGPFVDSIRRNGRGR
jgi:hemoglobin